VEFVEISVGNDSSGGITLSLYKVLLCFHFV